MVDALRRVHRMLAPHGCVIDIHPTADRSVIEVAGRPLGAVDGGDAPARHAAADGAAAAAVADGLFAIEHSEQFDFYTHAESIEELRDHIEANWRDTRVGEDIVRRAHEALAADPTVRPRARERVRMTKLILARARR